MGERPPISKFEHGPVHIVVLSETEVQLQVHTERLTIWSHVAHPDWWMELARAWLRLAEIGGRRASVLPIGLHMDALELGIEFFPTLRSVPDDKAIAGYECGPTRVLVDHRGFVRFELASLRTSHVQIADTVVTGTSHLYAARMLPIVLDALAHAIINMCAAAYVAAHAKPPPGGKTWEA